MYYHTVQLLVKVWETIQANVLGAGELDNRDDSGPWICKWTAMRTPLTERKRCLLHNAQGDGEVK